MATNYDESILHAKQLEGMSQPWHSFWQELADVCHPRRGQISSKSLSTPDTSRLNENFDNTAARSLDTLARGCSARITPMGAHWAVLRPPEDLADNFAALDWYARCSEILFRKLYVSNFYGRASEHYKDRGCFGTAATEVLGGKGGKGLHFRSYPIGSFSIGHDEQDEVNQFTRTFQWTPAQCAGAFGVEKLSKGLRKLFEGAETRNKPVEIRQSVLPRHDRNPFKSDAQNKPFASVYIYEPDKAIIGESGFDEFPLAVSRWELWGDSPWGWAPSYLALPEANQANHIEEMLDTLAEVAAFPRVLYAGNLKGEIDFASMGLTCWDPTIGGLNAPQEWLTGGRYDIGKDRAADKKRAIEEAFFVPLFNAISQLDKDATATEVRALVSESRELFHPIFSGLTREFLTPILRRSFSILLRQGELPPPPPAVVKQDNIGAFIDNPAVEFTSSMALALEQTQLADLADVFSVLGPMMELDPASADFIETDVVGPALFRAKGFPAAWQRAPERIAEIRSARAQASEIQQAEQAAGAVQKLGGPQGVQELAEIAQ